MVIHLEGIGILIVLCRKPAILYRIDLSPRSILTAASVEDPAFPVAFRIGSGIIGRGQGIGRDDYGLSRSEDHIVFTSSTKFITPFRVLVAIHQFSVILIAILLVIAAFILQLHSHGVGTGLIIGGSGILTAAAGNVKAADVAPNVGLLAFFGAEALGIFRCFVESAEGCMESRIVTFTGADNFRLRLFRGFRGRFRSFRSFGNRLFGGLRDSGFLRLLRNGRSGALSTLEGAVRQPLFIAARLRMLSMMGCNIVSNLPRQILGLWLSVYVCI